METTQLLSPERGVNPEPDGGWPWSLTPYEVDYVKAFNARPARPGWAGTERDEARLDDEAEGIRGAARVQPGRTMRRSAVLVTASVLVVGGLTAGGLGLANLLTALDSQAKTAELLVDDDD